MSAEECEYNVKFAMDIQIVSSMVLLLEIQVLRNQKLWSILPFQLQLLMNPMKTFTLNAPYENGTMASKGEAGSKAGEITSRINQQDHIRPQIFFPSIVTLKDPTEASFLYVFNNIIRTRHYGAQTTRTGRVRNELIGVIFADGEIVSNLRWTQAIYDQMQTNDMIQPPEPLNENDVISVAKDTIQALMAEELLCTLILLVILFRQSYQRSKI
jgi:CRISPR-associated protein Csc2